MFGSRQAKAPATPFGSDFRILAALSVPVFVLDAARRVVLWNAAIEELTGLKAAAVLGTQDHWRGFYDHQRPCLADLLFKDPGPASAALYTQMTAGDPQARTAENWCNMPLLGRRRYLRIEARAIRDAAGEVSAVVEILKDLTAEQDAKAALEASERDRQMQQFGLVSGSLGQALAMLAGGDLTHRMGDGLPDWAGQLATDFDAAAGTLQGVLVELSGNAGAIRDGSQQIAEAATDLSRRTVQQAESLRSTVDAVDGIMATVKRVTAGAAQARAAVGAARSDAEQSGGTVRNAVAAMDSIAQSSRQIDQIIGVIDEIAFQTNLLALNAGVEAARAGDAGRGFAVVASEVRALAQRSAEAAKEIKSLVSTSSRHVERGVGLVGEAGAALQRIAGKIADIDGAVGDIATMVEAQAAEVKQVNAAIADMERVTQQNSAMVRETTAAGDLLAAQSDQLSGIVGRFTLGTPAAASWRATAAPRPRRAAA